MSKRVEPYRDREARALVALAQRVLLDPKAPPEHVAGARSRLTAKPIDAGDLSRLDTAELALFRDLLLKSLGRPVLVRPDVGPSGEPMPLPTETPDAK